MSMQGKRGSLAFAIVTITLLAAWPLQSARMLASIVQDQPELSTETEVIVTEGTAMAAKASPNRLWIATDVLGGIWILPFRGGDAKKITPDFLEARLPTWAPNSESIAFQGYGDDGAWHIFVIGIDGRNLKQITDGPWDDREPAWSHDGSRILFSSSRVSGLFTIWEVMPESGAVRQITRRPGSTPCWAPADRGLAFVSEVPRKEESGIWTIESDGQERLVVAAPQVGSVGAPACGSRLAFRLVDQSGIHLIANRIFTVNEDVFPFASEWLGSEIMYTADGHIKRRSQNNLVSVIPFRAKVSLKRSV